MAKKRNSKYLPLGNVYDRGINPKISITFDKDIHKKIVAIAKQQGSSFSGVVQQLVARGLQS